MAELKWWKENLLLQNGKPQLIIQKDASKTGWGQSVRESPVKLAILTFPKGKSVTAIHLQIDNMTALSYLVKMGETRSPELLQVAKEIWGYLLGNGIAVTAEYLPSILNIQADWQSRNHRDLSDWKLNTKIFYLIVKIIGIPQIDLFAS